MMGFLPRVSTDILTKSVFTRECADSRVIYYTCSEVHECHETKGRDCRRLSMASIAVGTSMSRGTSTLNKDLEARLLSFLEGEQ